MQGLVATTFHIPVLAPNTTYHVVLKGTNNGVRFERRYSFTTGD